MATKAELQEQGYGVVVLGETAHVTAGKCWDGKEHAIPLGTFEEAAAHGYTPCGVCAPKENKLLEAVSGDDLGAAGDEAEA